MKKVLAVAVILLFLGVGVQPALANEVSNTVSDVDEDCLECQPVNRIDILKVKLLMIRVEAFTNVILSRFGHIPEIREKCEEISDRITNFQEMYNDLKLGSLNWDFPIICAFIDTIYTPIYNLFKIGVDLYWKYFNNPILWAIIGILDWLLYILRVTWEIFNCYLLQL